MTLRKKLFFLMTGMFFFPFLASGITLVFIFPFFGDKFDAADFIDHLQWIYDDFTPAVREGKALPSLPRQSFPFVFLSPDNEVVLSNVESFPAGTPAAPEAVFAAFMRLEGEKEQHIITMRVRRNQQLAGTIVTTLAVTLNPELFAIRESLLIFYAILTIIFVAAVGGARILRDIRRSIANLEGAAKKIAAGNYEFKLVPRGKDEFTSLTQAFETMRSTIQENSAQRARFLMAVSHDLKTPLTSIHGYLEALEDGMAGDEETRAKYLGIIRAKTDVLEERIFELIDFVRMQTGDWRMRHTRFGLKEFLEEISAVFAEDAFVEKRPFICKIDIPASAEISGDKELLRRVFENLFGNALRYSQENGSIEFSAQAAADGFEIRIINPGKGIPPEELELVFEPFYRGSSSRREAGFGLGLSSARSIINAHGWSIHAESEPGVRTSFIIRMPEN